jgi:predicted carbohydrate-binding protein with CBM5 and CBM33 domain
VYVADEADGFYVVTDEGFFAEFFETTSRAYTWPPSTAAPTATHTARGGTGRCGAPRARASRVQSDRGALLSAGVKAAQRAWAHRNASRIVQTATSQTLPTTSAFHSPTPSGNAFDRGMGAS